jgi:hypothetical protein
VDAAGVQGGVCGEGVLVCCAGDLAVLWWPAVSVAASGGSRLSGPGESAAGGALRWIRTARVPRQGPGQWDGAVRAPFFDVPDGQVRTRAKLRSAVCNLQVNLQNLTMECLGQIPESARFSNQLPVAAAPRDGCQAPENDSAPGS